MNRVAALLLIAMVAVFVQPTQQQIPDELSVLKGPTKQVRNMVRDLQSEIERKWNNKGNELYVLSHKIQIFGGVYYFVKIQDDNDEYAHVKIFTDFYGDVILNAVQLGKTFEDEIVSF